MANLPFESGELTELNLINDSHGQYAQRFESSFASYEFQSDNSWLVIDRQGNQYIFGSSEDGRHFDPDDPSRTTEWMLEESRDPNDNFIRYSYQKIDNQIYPDRITYTGHGQEEGIFEVRFLVDTSQIREDHQYSYATGFLVETNYLITGIEVYADGNLRRKYELNYTNIDPLIRQTLSSIIETGYDSSGNPTSLPPTTFEYTPSIISWQETSLYQPPIDIIYYNKTYDQLTSNYPLIVDASGDGLIDFRGPL